MILCELTKAGRFTTLNFGMFAVYCWTLGTVNNLAYPPQTHLTRPFQPTKSDRLIRSGSIVVLKVTGLRLVSQL